jgi:predicted phage baseplate assembly protein
VAIFTLEGDQWHTWKQQPDFDTSLRNGRHFLLDAMTGTVTFGDGEKGLPVPRGALIFAAYRHTRAAQGNVKTDQQWQLSPSPRNQALGVTGSQVNITNLFPAVGGEDAETINHAEGRGLAEVNRITRAVTLDDIEHLALNTPGTCLARVAVKANLDARYPCLKAPGTTTVVLLPKSKAAQPQPSPGLRSAVQQHLNHRRIIGSRLLVVGPTYTQVIVQARVQRQTQASQSRVQAAIVQALDDFFSPLHGGPGKTGWPFGRDVYRSEVMQVIDGVAGVENVIILELIADSGEPSCGNLCLGPCGLVVSGPHQIIVE